MGLKLQMLGTGSAFAKKNYNNNALIFSDDYTLMIDCGITAPMSLYKLGKRWDDIDAVLITHMHADHVGGLEEFAFQMKYVYGRRPVLYLAQDLAQPLWEQTLRGGLSESGTERLEDFFDVRLLTEGTEAQISQNLKVRLIRTPHIPGKPSYSIVLNSNIFYSADMTFQPELLASLVKEYGCRQIFHECQLRGPGQVHTTLDELLSLPKDIRNKISLMHYGDEWTEFEGKTGGMPFLREHEIYEL